MTPTTMLGHALAARTPQRRQQRRARHPVWSTHRRCHVEDASRVEAAALDHPEWLPRNLPEARGSGNDHVGYRDVVPDEAYRSIPVWLSRHHWVHVVVEQAILDHPEILAEHKVSPDMLRRWARVKSGYAWSNGRRCIVRPDVLASVLNCSERTVQRCNGLARALGLEVVLRTGRMLTQEERYQAYDMGSRQRGLATEVALTVPADQRRTVDRVTPPKRWVSNPPTLEIDSPHDGLTAGEMEAAPRPRPRKSRRRPHPGLQLAIETIKAVPWLTNEAPHRIAGVLTRFARCTSHTWTGHQLAAALTAVERRTGRRPMTRDQIRTTSYGVLAAKLREVDEVIDHPSLWTGPLITAPARIECGHPDCADGWLRHVITSPDGYDTVARCPNCQPPPSN